MGTQVCIQESLGTGQFDWIKFLPVAESLPVTQYLAMQELWKSHKDTVLWSPPGDLSTVFKSSTPTVISLLIFPSHPASLKWARPLCWTPILCTGPSVLPDLLCVATTSACVQLQRVKMWLKIFSWKDTCRLSSPNDSALSFFSHITHYARCVFLLPDLSQHLPAYQERGSLKEVPVTGACGGPYCSVESIWFWKEGSHGDPLLNFT